MSGASSGTNRSRGLGVFAVHAASLPVLMLAGVLVLPHPRSVKAQMKYANKIDAAFTVVLGDNELEQSKAKLKEMEKGDETEIALDDKFAVVFEEIYFNKIMDVMEGEAGDGNLFSFMGGEK
ncbi:MAG: hypothetical protein IKC21_04885, partial [Ruminococcus sp.]|nr:hypothetical protein [Ruminococcus sp.]